MMKFLKNAIFVSCVHLFVVSGLPAMGGGDGKTPLLGAGSGYAAKPDYGTTGQSASGAIDGKGAKSTGGSDTHAAESKDPDTLTPAAFFAHIKAGNLDDVKNFLATNPTLSQCEQTVESGVKSAIWYALELALSATVGPEVTKFLQILKVIFDASKQQYAPDTSLVILGEEVLDNAPTWCCCGQAAHLGSLLHHAVDKDNVTVANFLVDNKIVDPNQASNHGHPPLAFAKSTRMARALIERGADVNHTTSDGIHVLDLIRNPDVQRTVAVARATAGYVERNCTCCGPCVLECESCGCAPKMCDLLSVFRSCFGS